MNKLTLLMLLLSTTAVVEAKSLFNKTAIRSIVFKKEVSISPGTKRTLISGHLKKCFLYHDESGVERILSAGREFPVVKNKAVTTSYSSFGNDGFARIEFSGLNSASFITCHLSNKWDDEVTIQDIQSQLGESVKINLQDVKEID